MQASRLAYRSALRGLTAKQLRTEQTKIDGARVDIRDLEKLRLYSEAVEDVQAEVTRRKFAS